MTTTAIHPDSVEQRSIVLHGHEIRYREAGDGPTVLLLHGITGSSRHWDPVIGLLAEHFRVIAPDLLGHGRSAKPRGDYSLGAYAAGMRDMMLALGHDQVTVVGHSLGGGIAMQFAYQFPERCGRLALVGSGGLGREVHLLLRAAALPGAELVLPLIAHGQIAAAGELVGRLLARVGLSPKPDVAEVSRGYATLADADTRHAFLMTLRSVVDPGGQRISALDRLYLSREMPSLLIWGERDPIIPAAHGRAAHLEMPGSRLEVFEGAGHFPQLDEPFRFSRALRSFIHETEPAEIAVDELRERLLERATA